MSYQAKSATAAFVASLGAFLFGLDIGYIAPILGCPGFKHDVAHLPDWSDKKSQIPAATEGFIVGSFSLGAILTAFPVVSSYFIDEWGRRNSIMMGAAIFLLGCVLQAEAVSINMFLAGRLVTGCSIGLLSSVVPLYQAEMAPPQLRGTLTSLYNLMITAGIFCATLADEFLVKESDGWRIAIWIQVLPASIILGVMPFLPRSPRWLVRQNFRREAEETLLEIRAGWTKGSPPQNRDPEQEKLEAEARKEFREIIQEHEAEWAQSQGSDVSKWKELSRGRSLRLMLVGAGLQMMQQLVGMNAFMYFGPKIFHTFQLSHPNFYQTLTVFTNFVFTFPALYLVERAGRRSLLLAGAAGMAGACFTIGVMGQLAMKRSGGQWVSTDMSVGPAMASMIFAFVAVFACTWGPCVWVYCAEMFPLKIRATCLGITTMTNWIGNYLIAQFTPMLLDSLGLGTFHIFGIFCSLAFLLAYWLPETSGVSLEHIGELFDEKFGSVRAPKDSYGSVDQRIKDADA